MTTDPYEQKLRGRVLNALRPATRRTKVSLDLLCRYMEARGAEMALAKMFHSPGTRHMADAVKTLAAIKQEVDALP